MTDSTTELENRVKQNKRLTLKDLAKHLNVSTATISNAFNRPDQLSRALREHIIDECLELGYSGPNSSMRKLRANRTGIIGVMLSNYLSYSFTDPVAHQFLSGLSLAFDECEYSMIILPSRDHVNQAQGYETFVDGFIVYGPPQQNTIKRLVHLNKSIITVDFELERCVSVNINNYLSAKEGAEYVLSKSTGVIGVLGLRLVNINQNLCLADYTQELDPKNITVQRLRGYQDAALQHQQKIMPQNIWQVPDNTHEYAYEAAKQLLASDPQPTILFCMSDRIALAAMQVIKEMELSIPEQIQIIGFDDIPESRCSSPALTSIRQPSYEKGVVTGEIFTGKRIDENIILPTELMIRESTL